MIEVSLKPSSYLFISIPAVSSSFITRKENFVLFLLFSVGVWASILFPKCSFTSSVHLSKALGVNLLFFFWPVVQKKYIRF